MPDQRRRALKSHFWLTHPVLLDTDLQCFPTISLWWWGSFLDIDNPRSIAVTQNDTKVFGESDLILASSHLSKGRPKVPKLPNVQTEGVLLFCRVQHYYIFSRFKLSLYELNLL